MGILRYRLRSAFRWSLLEKAIILFGGLLQLVVIVRYLEKEELGLMAITNTVISFAAILTNLGLGQSLLHKRDTSPTQLSSLFWSFCFSGIILCLATNMLSGPIAKFFGENQLTLLINLMSVNILISCSRQLHYALLYRDIQIRLLSGIHIAGFSTGVIITLSLVISGFGLMSLVIGAIVKECVNTLLIFWFGSRYFLLRAVFDFPSVRHHFSFGLAQTGIQLANTFNQQFDTLLIGKLLGTETLGVYDVLKQFFIKPITYITPVIINVYLPLIARFQQRISVMNKLYLRQVSLICSINFPVYCCLAINAGIVLHYIFSPSWVTDPNIHLTVLFCVYFMVYSIQKPIGTIVIASGLVRRALLYNLAITVVLPVLIVLVADQGVEVILGTMLVFHTAMIFAAQRLLLLPGAGVSAGALVIGFSTPLLIGLFSFAPLLLISGNDNNNLRLPATILMTLLCSGLYLAISNYLNPRLIKNIRSVLH